jgi:hypothetical protein
MRSIPRLPAPSSCGPTLPPLPPTWWQFAQFLANTSAPSLGSAFAAAKPTRRRVMSAATFGSVAGLEKARLDLLVLQQSGRGLALGDGLEQSLGPRLVSRQTRGDGRL